MTKRALHQKTVAVLVLATAALLLVTGCSTLDSKDQGASSSGSTGASAVQPEKSHVYLDFGDVMLPRELKVDKKESFVMNTGGMTSGVLVMSGGVDANSLVNFFENKMPVDGWHKIGSFRSARSMMLFEKTTRWCAIAITDGKFSTKVEIWVAPTTAKAKSGLHK